MPAPKLFYLYEIRKKFGIYYPTTLLEESSDIEIVRTAQKQWENCQSVDPNMEFLITVNRLKIF